MYSAGILPVYKSSILLGKERRGWSGFSGKCDKDDEDILCTAIREFQEETAGLLDIDCVKSLIQGAVLVESVTPRGHKFHLYVMNVTKKEYDALSNNKFQLKRKTVRLPQQREKVEIKWVDISEIYELDLSQCFKHDLKTLLNVINVMHSS